MKTMWTSEGGVSQVQVREHDGQMLATHADGHEWQPFEGTIHETEVDARRAWLLSQETGFENELGSLDTTIQQRETEIKRANIWLKELCADRARVDGQLAEVRAQLAALKA